MSSDQISFNQVAQLIKKFRRYNWGTARITQLGQADEEKYRRIEAVLDTEAGLTNPILIILPAIKEPKRLKDRDNVYFSGRAYELFSADYKLPIAKERTIKRRDLIKELGDFEIIEKLGGEDAVVFGSVALIDLAIGQLIDATEAGSDNLLTRRKANVVYIRGLKQPKWALCVDINWRSVRSEWEVGCGPAIVDQWDAGCRVFEATAT